MTQPKRDNINAAQATMLSNLRDSAHAISAAELFTNMDISRGFGMKQMAGLRDADLVTQTSPFQNRRPALWTISMAGRRALGDYARKLEQAATRAMAVAPPTNSFWGTTYTPPATAYYRNDGNRHIPSAGVQC